MLSTSAIWNYLPFTYYKTRTEYVT